MLYLIVALIAVFAVVSDQITKYLVVTCLSPEGTSVDVIPGVYRFTYVRNGNGMMGLFDEHRWVFVVLSCIVVGAIIFYFWKMRPKNRLLCISLGMILGGGLGNMIDRIFHADGKVVDFIDFCAFPKVWKYIFNVADIFVTVGVCLLFVYLICDTVKEYRNEKARKAAEAAEATEAAVSVDVHGQTDVAADGATPRDESTGDRDPDAHGAIDGADEPNDNAGNKSNG